MTHLIKAITTGGNTSNISVIFVEITLHSAVPPSKLLMVSPLDMERLSPVTQEDAMPLVLVDLSDLIDVVSAFSLIQKRVDIK